MRDEDGELADDRRPEEDRAHAKEAARGAEDDDGGGQPACITDDWAVNICCEPCTCWLSPQPADGSPGGSGNMTIVEHGYEGRDYTVLVNSDGLAVAAPFPCAETGLFGRRGVLQMETWQAAMGDCSHNPMDGR